MATNKTDAGSTPDRATVTMDAELIARLVSALEMIGTAFAVDEVNDARALSLIGHLAGRGDGRPSAGILDPGRARAARDYDVLRGLLGKADAPRPLTMRRSRDTVVFVDAAPLSAATVVVESPGDAKTSALAERFDVEGLTTPTLRLTRILQGMPVSRVEVLDEQDTLLAFGPSLPPINRTDGG
jgi:hypothetical protein